MTHYTKRILTELAYLAVMVLCCLAFVLIAQHLEKKPKSQPKAIYYPSINNYKPLKTN